MIISNAKQGTAAWHHDRAGCITASTFAEAVSTTGGLTEQQHIYVDALKSGKSQTEAMALANYKSTPRASGIDRALAGLPVGEPSEASMKLAVVKAIERISGKPYGWSEDRGRGIYAIERGHEEESFGRMIYESRYGVIVDEVGLVKTDDGVFGASPDGLVNRDGTIECKTPANPLKALYLVQSRNISEYVHQIQGNLWILNRQWCDLIVPNPDLAALNNGNELFVMRVERDDAFIEKMVAELWEFYARSRRFEEILRKPFDERAAQLVSMLEEVEQ